MPIYEYQCQACQSVFEEWQSGFEEKDMECPECGEQAKRLISHTSFHLKGSGWYVTDYAGKTPSGSANDGNGNGDGTSAEAKTDSGGVDSAPTTSKESSDSPSAGSAS